MDMGRNNVRRAPPVPDVGENDRGESVRNFRSANEPIEVTDVPATLTPASDFPTYAPSTLYLTRAPARSDATFLNKEHYVQRAPRAMDVNENDH